MAPLQLVRVATWNLQWRGPASPSASVIHDRLRQVGPDVAVLTEARLSLLKGWASRETAGLAVYKGTPADGSKVVMVSQNPLEVVDGVGNEELPPGNFLAVDVDTVAGPLRIIGVVIRYNQKEQYIAGLPRALERTVTDRTVLAGDFNLKLPGGGLATRLTGVLADFGLTVRTAGFHSSLAAEPPLIDHIAASDALRSDDLEVWGRRDSRFRDGAMDVTDHAGSSVTVDPQRYNPGPR